jgi:splicing factor 3B subunit 2
MVKRPDLVDPWDITAEDPLFLIWLKQTKNSVPVPLHWNQKRKFLQYKRGLHKPPFKLPDYIENTGIGKIREGTRDAGMSLKQ